MLAVASAFGVMLLGSAVVQAGEPTGEALWLYHQERYDEAAQRLQGALQQQPDDPLLHYDLGTVAYGKGDYQASEEAFNKALAAADAGLLGRTWYNLGNTHYRQGQVKEATAPSEAVALYRKALGDYRMAIRSDPDDRDARYNYELVERRMKSLMQRASQEAEGSQQQAGGKKEEGGWGREEEQKAVSGKQETEGGEQNAEGNAQKAEREGQDEQPSAGEESQALREGESGEPSQEAGARGEASESDAAGQGPGDQQKAGGSKQEAEGQDGEQARSSGTEGKEMSQREALWILDAARQEERRAPVGQQQGLRRERPVEQDW